MIQRHQACKNIFAPQYSPRINSLTATSHRQPFEGTPSPPILEGSSDPYTFFAPTLHSPHLGMKSRVECNQEGAPIPKHQQDTSIPTYEL
jgi:hypothetical protein